MLKERSGIAVEMGIVNCNSRTLFQRDAQSQDLSKNRMVLGSYFTAGIEGYDY